MNETGFLNGIYIFIMLILLIITILLIRYTLSPTATAKRFTKGVSAKVMMSASAKAHT